MQPGSTASPQTQGRVLRLRRILEQLRSRRGDIEVPETLERTERSIARRESRIRVLRRRIKEAEKELHWLESEVEGLMKSYEMVLGEMIGRFEHTCSETWSPTPVLGYRIWDLRMEGLFGVRVRWERPELDAVCKLSVSDGEIPHTDGRCGRLGCGVYAAKDVGSLLRSFVAGKQSGFAVGLVGMSGKVVEHERGYRAAHAAVLALVVAGSANLVFTDDPALIAKIFDDPWTITGAEMRPEQSSEDLHDQIEQYLLEQAWRRQWTSENRNG